MMKGMAPEIASLCKYQETDREKTVKVLFGKYMEKFIYGLKGLFCMFQICV